MKKRVMLLLIGLVVAGVFCSIIVSCLLMDDYPKFTSDIKDYGSDKYLLDSSLFLPTIPSSAKVVDFSYYNYWNEAKDIYLEVRFTSREEMDAYLAAVNEHSMEELEQYCMPTYQEWFVSETCIYDTSYTDSFCLFFRTYHAGEEYTGYSIHPLSISGVTESVTYDCNFGLISYSYEELTVIQTISQGVFRKTVHDYIPAYFKRFHVPLNEEHSRVFNIA